MFLVQQNSIWKITHNILKHQITSISPPFLFLAQPRCPLGSGPFCAPAGPGSGASPPCRATTRRWRSSRKPGVCWHGQKMPCNMQYRQNSKRVLSWGRCSGEIQEKRGILYRFCWVGCNVFFSFFHRDFGFLKWFLCAFFAEALPPLLMDEISLAPVEVGTLPFFHPSCWAVWIPAINSCTNSPTWFSSWNCPVDSLTQPPFKGWTRKPMISKRHVVPEWVVPNRSTPRKKIVSPVRRFDEVWSINFYRGISNPPSKTTLIIRIWGRLALTKPRVSEN